MESPELTWTFSLISLLLWLLAHCHANTVIRLGGILADGAEESAFRLAVDFVNEKQLMGDNTTLEYVTKKSGALSSFSVMQIACEHASVGVMAILGPMSSTATRSVAPLSEAMSIPQLSPISTNPLFDDASRYPFLIRMLPPDTMQSLALIDLVEAFGWRKLTVLTSNTDYGINGMLKFQSSAARRNWQILSVQHFEALDDLDKVDARRQLRVIKSTGVRVVVLNCLAQFGVRVLQQAEEEGMLGAGWAWVVTDGMTGPVEQLPGFMTGLVGTRPSTHNGLLWNELEKQWTQANRTDYPGTGSELNAFSASVMDAVFTFAYAMKTLLTERNTSGISSPVIDCSNGSWENGPLLLKHLRQVKGAGTANDIEFNSRGSPLYPRYDIVNLRPEGWLKLGHWDPENHLDAGFKAREVVFPGNQSHVNDYVSLLANRTLRAVMLNEQPFTRLIGSNYDPTELKRGDVEGLCIDLFDRLAELIGFNYTMYEVPDKLYGKEDPDTYQWNGLIKELVTKEADIAIAPLTINHPRETDIDFTKPYQDLGMRFIIKIPEVEPERAFRFLDPFQGDVWMMTLVMTVVVGLYVSLLNKLSPYDHHGEFIYQEHVRASQVCYKKYRQLKRIKIQTTSTLNFSNSVWFSIAALLQQGGETYPKSTSARIALLTWLFAIVILVATYTANLAAFLTTSRSKTSINSIEELGAQTKIKYGTVRGSAPQQFFEDSEITLFKDMLLYMKQQRTLVNVSKDGVNQAREGGFAFIWDSAVLDYTVEETPCNTIRNVGQLFGKIGYGFGLQKNSPYKDELSYYILKLREEGYIDGLVHKWYVQKGECRKEEESTEQEKAIEAAGGKLGIDQMLGVFIIAFVGVIASVGVLVFEWVVAVQSNVDKKDPFRPDTFGDSLGQRLTAVKEDFVEEKYGCCLGDDPDTNANNSGEPRHSRPSLSDKVVYKVTTDDVIQTLAGSIARRQRRNLPISYQGSLESRSTAMAPAEVLTNGHVHGDTNSSPGLSQNDFSMDSLDIGNFALQRRHSYTANGIGRKMYENGNV